MHNTKYKFNLILTSLCLIVSCNSNIPNKDRMWENDKESFSHIFYDDDCQEIQTDTVWLHPYDEYLKTVLHNTNFELCYDFDKIYYFNIHEDDMNEYGELSQLIVNTLNNRFGCDCDDWSFRPIFEENIMIIFTK